MSEKVIRVSAEDSGFSETVNRMGDNMRKAFGNMGLGDVLEEADQKFSNFTEKVKFITNELNEIKRLNITKVDEEIDRVRGGGGNKTDKRREVNRLEKHAEEQNKGIDKLIDSLNKFGDKSGIEQASQRRQMEGGSGSSGSGGGYLNVLKDVLRGNIGGAFNRTRGLVGQNIVRSLEGMNSTMGRSLLAMGGIIGAAITGAIVLGRKGYEDLRSENKFKSRNNIGDDFADDSQALAILGLSRSEFRESGSATALSRRSNMGLQNETMRRTALMRGYDLEQGQFAGFDKFYRAGAQGQNLADVDKNMDAIRTIQNILVRSEQQGILGVSNNDFNMLPEKIAQVQGIMQMQFQNNERVNANAAVNMIMAGQQIGGRFADERAGEAFGRIDGSIRQPNGPGMRAFVFEMLRRSNPGGSYTDIMAQMEGGATPENLKAILPTIAQLPQGEQRRMILYQLTKNWQDAKRLDQAGNLEAMIKTIDQKPISDKEGKQAFGTALERTDKLSTNLDKYLQNISNEATKSGKELSKIAEWTLKNANLTMGSSGTGLTVATLPIAGDTLRTNIIPQGSTTGQTQKK